ncbi:MAG TPA: YncE family protein [Longimicrobium sp.]|nr:YncE family protein [Longimicrobium sp.]
MTRGIVLAALAAAVCGSSVLAAQPRPERTYHVWVAGEAVDRLALVRFGPDGARVEREVGVGRNLLDPDGPHGVDVSPDGRRLYVSTGHGTPFGDLWVFSASGDSVLGRVTLGSFPATLQVSPDGAFAYVVNFNLHGEHVPSSLSVVSTDPLVEVARIPTCIMPHGSRLSADGARHYSACMMDDVLVEVDTRTLGVARHFRLTRGAEAGMRGAPGPDAPGGSPADHGGHGTDAPPPGGAACSPTWAQPSPDGGRVWVACNGSSEIVEVDVASWRLVRRIPAGEGVYNLAVTSDGALLVATNKRGRSVSLFDARGGRELARIPTLRRVVHGVAISPDDRYAFVSVEGVGSEPGTVEVIDLRARRRVAAVDVGQMAGGIDIWKVEP